MKTAVKNHRTDVGVYGPDPVLMKKSGLTVQDEKNIAFYKKRIGNEEYLDHAINRIAMELSHFLAKYRMD